MTLYLDTSNLVKRYIEEDDSDRIEELAKSADVVATSKVAYAEARAAFARRRRERRLTSAAYATIKRRFDLEWPAYLSMEVTEAVARSAGALADRLKLRGFDALHLASFELLLSRVEDDEVHFSSADTQLTRAAQRLG